MSKQTDPTRMPGVPEFLESDAVIGRTVQDFAYSDRGCHMWFTDGSRVIFAVEPDGALSLAHRQAKGHFWARDRAGEPVILLHLGDAWFLPGIEDPVEIASYRILGHIRWPKD